MDAKITHIQATIYIFFLVCITDAAFRQQRTTGSSVSNNTSISNIIVSLTTVPGRENSLRQTIDSLLHQTVRIPILVCIPLRSIRFGSQLYRVPDWLIDFPGVRVYRCTDMGPATKILAALEYVAKETNDKPFSIITVDDDIIYHPRLVENLVQYGHEYPDGVIAHAGHRILGPPYRMPNFDFLRPPHHSRFWGRPVEFPVVANALHGYAGAMYQVSFFDELFMDYDSIGELSQAAFWVDDDWISGNLGRRGVPIYVVPSPEPLMVRVEEAQQSGLNFEARNSEQVRFQEYLIAEFVARGWMHVLSPPESVSSGLPTNVYQLWAENCPATSKLVERDLGNFVCLEARILIPTSGNLVSCRANQGFQLAYAVTLLHSACSSEAIMRSAVSLYMDGHMLETMSYAWFTLETQSQRGVRSFAVPFLKAGRHFFELSVDDHVTDSVEIAFETSRWLQTGCLRSAAVDPADEDWHLPASHAAYGDMEYDQGTLRCSDGVITALLVEVGEGTKLWVSVRADTWLNNALQFPEGLQQDSEWASVGIDLRQDQQRSGIVKNVGPEKLDGLLLQAGCPSDFAVLSISDVMGLDFYVWAALNSEFKPRIVIVQFNSFIPFDRDCVIPLDTLHRFDGSVYFGASLLSMYNLAKRKGYSLVYADKGGTTALFIRNDLVPKVRPSDHLNNVSATLGLVRLRKCLEGDPNDYHWWTSSAALLGMNLSSVTFQPESVTEPELESLTEALLESVTEPESVTEAQSVIEPESITEPLTCKDKRLSYTSNDKTGNSSDFALVTELQTVEEQGAISEDLTQFKARNVDSGMSVDEVRELCSDFGYPALKQAAGPRRVFDAFMFFNELEILEIRLHELYPVVSKFVLVESTLTFSNVPKSLVFENNRHRFERYLDKIEHVVVELPTATSNCSELNCEHWRREQVQRDAMMLGLQRAGAEERDIVLIADVDELIPRDVLLVLRECRTPLPLTVASELFHFSFRWRITRDDGTPFFWFHPQAASMRQVRAASPSLIRSLGEAVDLFGFISGWHCSYFGGAAAVAAKVGAYSHQELNDPAINNPGHIEGCIRSGRTLTRGNMADGGVLHDGALPEQQPRDATRRPLLLLAEADRFGVLLGYDTGDVHDVPPTVGSHRHLRVADA